MKMQTNAATTHHFITHHNNPIKKTSDTSASQIIEPCVMYDSPKLSSPENRRKTQQKVSLLASPKGKRR